MRVQGPSAAQLGSAAEEMLEEITVAVGAAEQEAGDIVAEAKEKLAAIKTANVSVAEKFSLIEDVLMKVISAGEVRQCYSEDIKRKLGKLVRMIRKWQVATDSLAGRVTTLEEEMATTRNQLSMLMEEHESKRRDIFLGECAFIFAKLLQEHTFKVRCLTFEIMHSCRMSVVSYLRIVSEPDECKASFRSLWFGLLEGVNYLRASVLICECFFSGRQAREPAPPHEGGDDHLEGDAQPGPLAEVQQDADYCAPNRQPGLGGPPGD